MTPVGIIRGDHPPFHREGLLPSFAAKPAGMRVGIEHAGTAPRLDEVLAAKVAAIKARETAQ